MPRFLLPVLLLACIIACSASGSLAEEPAAAPAAPDAPAEMSASEAPELPPASPAPPPGHAPTEEQPTPASPVPQPAPPPPLPDLIISIDVLGNKDIPPQDIRDAISSKVGAPYSESRVERDRQAIRDLGWFQTVAVERESVETGVRLLFRVVENPVITDIQFDGIRELTREELLGVMKTKPGQVYNGPLVLLDGQAIQELYRSRGYILAIVVGQRMDQEGVLTLTIAEGVIEDIKVTGNTHTKAYVIRRYIRTKVGETYNDRKVAGDVARLTNLGYFETVRREAEAGTEPGKVIIVITVVEKKRTGMATLGAGYTSVQGMVCFVDLVKTNLRGTGQTVSIRGEFGGRTSYEFGYRHPWIMNPETRLSLGIYDRLILREAFVAAEDGDQRSILYDERRSGGNVTLGRPLSDYTTAYLGLRRDDVSISGLNEEEEQFLTGPAFEPREVRSLTLATVTDKRSNPFNPRKGFYQQLSAEIAGVFGGVDFNKYTADHRRYLPVAGRNVLAFRLLLGTVSGDAPYLEQFLIGGPESLRGYRNDRFAGARMAILNTEYRFPISKNLLGVLFVDLGDAWGGALARDPYFQGDESFIAHLGYGAGVRVQTPIGPIRLDLGFSEEGTETHFGLSHMF
jgi:outer membrane protein insertion porin family